VLNSNENNIVHGGITRTQAKGEKTVTAPAIDAAPISERGEETARDTEPLPPFMTAICRPKRVLMPLPVSVPANDGQGRAANDYQTVSSL
jgi:hypothetical protein